MEKKVYKQREYLTPGQQKVNQNYCRDYYLQKESSVRYNDAKHGGFPGSVVLKSFTMLSCLLSYMDVSESWLNGDTNLLMSYSTCGASNSCWASGEQRVMTYVTFSHRVKAA